MVGVAGLSASPERMTLRLGAATIGLLDRVYRMAAYFKVLECGLIDATHLSQLGSTGFNFVNRGDDLNGTCIKWVCRPLRHGKLRGGVFRICAARNAGRRSRWVSERCSAKHAGMVVADARGGRAQATVDRDARCDVAAACGTRRGIRSRRAATPIRFESNRMRCAAALRSGDACAHAERIVAEGGVDGSHRRGRLAGQSSNARLPG